MKRCDEKRAGNGLVYWFLRAILVASLISQRGGRAQTHVLFVNVSEQYLKVAADQERAGFGLSPLRVDVALSAAAHQHALRMAEHRSISHKYTDEPDLTSRAAAAGARFSLVTENVGQAPSALLLHSAWMHSEGHRHNLLDPKVDSVGIAVVERNGQMFAVEDFARTVALLSIDEQENVVARVVRASSVEVDVATKEARQVCAGSSSAEMKDPPEFVTRYTTDNLDRLPDELASRLHSHQFRRAVVGACSMAPQEEFSMFRVAVLLYLE